MNKLLMSGKKKTNTAKFYCTTTGAATLTIAQLTVTAPVTVLWGDGSSDTYSGAGARTHNYAGAGTWTVTMTPPTAISKLTLSDNKITLNSKEVKACVNMLEFNANGLKAGRFDSSDVSAWRPTTFYLNYMPAGYAGTFNSSDVSAWRPTTFYLNYMPAGYLGTFNSSDVSAWRPTDFRLFTMPAGYAGTFNSSDVSSWRPSYFFLNSMPAGYTGTFNSADVSAWRPTTFILYYMPAGYTITTTAGGFAGWITAASIRFDDNALTQAQVNQILSDLWTAFQTRTATGGTINVGGSNAAPSGLLQAANPPTTGKEFAYELAQDSQNKNPTKKWATVTITA